MKKMESRYKHKYYLPKSLIKDRVDPVFDRRDIIYFKFVKNNKIIRVARADPVKGLVLELYPTDNPNHFFGEGYQRIEDNSVRILLKRPEIGDKIWLDLLIGVDPNETLKDYKPQPLGYHPSGSYEYCDGGRTFHIVEMEEAEPPASAVA